ncbi:hypothetical protein GGQ84_000983 [Desulfitispora alkaliphila]|uniref:PD-(D/E)XK motif protein n=1 Tax=Desulfitispora alkaliphila TaxID=622674 RepID=UPI003D1C27F3
MPIVEQLGTLLTKQVDGDIVSKKLRGKHRFYLAYSDLDKEFTFSYQCSKPVNNFSPFKCKGFSVIPSSTKINCVSVPGFESVFMRVMEDLYSGSKEIESEYVDRWIMKRLKRWKCFFEYHEAEKMSKEMQMGLFGELKTLIDLYEAGISDAILYWKGPERSEHDFILPHTHYECKVIAADRNSVTIHGVAQLFCDTQLILRVYKVALDEGSQSIHDLVTLCELFISPKFEDLFEDLLGKYGYIPGQKDVYNFNIKECIDYNVKEGFPRISRIDGIDNVEYSLKLDSCKEFRIES